jgi:uncharacterized phage-like protein YoqJ
VILAVTGHRPPRLGGYRLPNAVFEAVMRSLDEQLLRLQPTAVYTGMALGVDQWAADLCAFNDIPYDAILPFEGYEAKWPSESQRVYNQLLEQARNRRFLAPRPPEGANVDGLIRMRNRYLVREADALLAVYNRDPRTGTGKTVDFALSMHKPVYFAEIRPDLWAQARTIWEQEEARREFRLSQERSRMVAQLGIRRNSERAERMAAFDPRRRQVAENFAQAFPVVVEAANEEKRVEQIKEDIQNHKPRRVIDLGDD